MDRILILDRDQDHAEALAARLRHVDRSIVTCADERIALAKSNANEIDVLIVVPPVRSLWKEQVHGICTALNIQFNRPAVLCVLWWEPQGPADRLFGDLLGVEVQHEY
jgi:DNA-binding response OmpR family regulator